MPQKPQWSVATTLLSCFGGDQDQDQLVLARTFLHLDEGSQEAKTATRRAASEPPLSGPRPLPTYCVDYGVVQESLLTKSGTWSLARAMTASVQGVATTLGATHLAHGHASGESCSRRSSRTTMCGSCSPSSVEEEFTEPLKLLALQTQPGFANSKSRDAVDDDYYAGDEVTFQLPWAEKSGQLELQENLLQAVLQNDTEMVRRLLHRGADPNAVASDGMHILFRAVMNSQRLQIVGLLLDAQADVRWKDPRGAQVLHFLAHATTGQEALIHITQLLLDAGAEVNAQRDDGIAPLHRVLTRHGSRRTWLHFHQARLLIQHGADPHIRTHSGQTPLSMLVCDQRITTLKLQQLLEAEGGSMPGCDGISCPWCPPPKARAIEFTQQGSIWDERVTA